MIYDPHPNFIMGQKISSLCEEKSNRQMKNMAIMKKIANSTPSPADAPAAPPEKLFAGHPQVTVLSHKTFSNKSNKETKEGSNSIRDLANQSKFAVEDFTFYNILGVGDFGRVFLARYLYNDQFYAIKVIKKRQINVRHTSFKQVLTERQILASCESKFIVKMFASFQNQNNFYFVLEYVSAGNLSNYLRKMKKFSLDQARFCVAEIILGLEYLHEELHVIHRDLKPENILIDKDGHIKLTDFALAKIGVTQTHSFCGTKCYFSPELITKAGYDNLVDYWTLGCLTYEMIVGRPPFYHSNNKILYDTILSGTYQKDHLEDPLARDFVESLLQREPSRRLGNQGIKEILAHPFLQCLDLDSMRRLEVPSPLKPHVIERKPEVLISQVNTMQKRTISSIDVSSIPKSTGSNDFSFASITSGQGGSNLLSLQDPYSQLVKSFSPMRNENDDIDLTHDKN